MRRIIVALVGIVAVIALLFTFGVKALLSLGSVLSVFSDQKVEQPTTKAPLIAPRLEPVDTATNSARIAIKGIGQEGATAELFVNDQSYAKNVIGKNGDFLFENVELKEGQNSVYAILELEDGTKSIPSQKQFIIYDKTPPKLDITTPTDGATIKGQKELKVTGKSEPDVTVTVNDAIAIVNQDGSFSYSMVLNEGQTTIKVVATDVAGNQTTMQRVVNYQP